jgi:hypothetical protein
MQGKFSTRHGFEPREPEIKFTHEAPHDLRGIAVDIAYEAGMNPHSMRNVVCHTLRIRKDENNYSAPNVNDEVRDNIDNCEWYEVYDVIEGVYRHLLLSVSVGQADHFAVELNKYLKKSGIGWQLVDGEVRIRGDRLFEHAVVKATKVLDEEGRSTAARELREALHDLSRRPEPDLTGALQHSLAALECVMRDVCTDQKATLGALLSRYRGIIPAPLDHAVEKIWGFASEQGRHVREGDAPSAEEAELAVHVAGAVATYLTKKHGG